MKGRIGHLALVVYGVVCCTLRGEYSDADKARWVMLSLFLARRSETAPTLARVLAVVVPKLN